MSLTLCAATAICGCSLRLDFDSLSRGGHALDAQVGDSAVDAGAPRAGDGALAAEDPHSTGAFDAPFFSQAAAAPAPESFACATLISPPTFCDDFETSALRDHWTNPIEIPGTSARISIVDAGVRAGRGALLAELDDTAVADNFLGAYALEIFEDFAKVPIRASIDFDLRVELIDPGPGRYVALFEFNFGDILGDHNDLLIRLESQGVTAHAHFVERDVIKLAYPLPGPDTESLFEHDFVSTPELNEWTHFRFELDAPNPTGSGNLARVSLGEYLLFEGPLHFPLRALSPRIGVGLPWPSTLKFPAEDPSRAWRVRYDNVLVRIAPR